MNKQKTVSSTTNKDTIDLISKNFAFCPLSWHLIRKPFIKVETGDKTDKKEKSYYSPLMGSGSTIPSEYSEEFCETDMHLRTVIVLCDKNPSELETFAIEIIDKIPSETYGLMTEKGTFEYPFYDFTDEGKKRWAVLFLPLKEWVKKGIVFPPPLIVLSDKKINDVPSSAVIVKPDSLKGTVFQDALDNWRSFLNDNTAYISGESLDVDKMILIVDSGSNQFSSVNSAHLCGKVFFFVDREPMTIVLGSDQEIKIKGSCFSSGLMIKGDDRCKISLDIENSRFFQSKGDGLYVAAQGTVIVKNCVAQGNKQNGMVFKGISQEPSILDMELECANTTATYNGGHGIVLGSGTLCPRRFRKFHMFGALLNNNFCGMNQEAGLWIESARFITTFQGNKPLEAGDYDAHWIDLRPNWFREVS